MHLILFHAMPYDEIISDSYSYVVIQKIFLMPENENESDENESEMY